MLDKEIEKLAKKYNLDPRIVKEICNSPFRFTANRIRQGDEKPIRLTYLFKIKPKTNCLTRLRNERACKSEE